MKTTRTLITLSLLLSACSTFQPVKDKSIHHLLEPLVPERPLSVATPTIAVRHPTLPGYLDRQQLIARREGGIFMNKADLWGEPLDSGIARVLAADIARLTGSINVLPVQSFTSSDYDQLLEVRVSQFEADPTGNMIFEGAWRLAPVSGPVPDSRFFRIVTTPASLEAKDRVSAMNEALEKLARKVMQGR